MPSSLPLTERQQEAVQTTGKSLLVAAAAGSGKTAVLAERCAHLVCDAPPGARCDVDQLLVLTFTDAAAGEMRDRIVSAIRERAEAKPQDVRLREQIARVDSAQLSTIHAFCLWMIRRWFSHLGVDPLARLMDEHETSLLKRKVLDQLFLKLYGGDSSFAALVNDYGLGDDREIGRFVLRLYHLTESLPDPQRWLARVTESVSDGARRTVAGFANDLAQELLLQSEECAGIVEALRRVGAPGDCYAEPIGNYREQLDRWFERLQDDAGSGEHREARLREADGDRDPDEYVQLLAHYEQVRREIKEYSFESTRTTRLSKDATDQEKKAHKSRKDQFSRIKNDLFGKRLHKRFGLFSVDECLEGLAKTAPYVDKITDLVRTFRIAYSAKKRELSALDFADLEHFALDLLRDGADSPGPSDVARSVQDRFAYVLVDEFQDINRIQHEIIRLVSRESDSQREDNLFSVGDVKQSIYSFRLAEPMMFADRLQKFRDGGSAGGVISLQQNFRSRREILDAVNHVFRSLMRRGRGGVVYDDEAEMRPGRAIAEAAERDPIELHILERTWKGGAVDDDDGTHESTPTDDRHPSHWSSIQREAFLIGNRIRNWMDSNKSFEDGGRCSFGDIVILLRAHRNQADQVAKILESIGIPARADVGGSLLDSREVRDVLAALRILDNLQQDIPLASVLRSGIFGDALSADEMAEIRCLDRDTHFHEVVRRYATEGADEKLRGRLEALLARINRYRDAARKRPLAECVWRLYAHEGFLAYVGGLPAGARRRANLQKLHELTRGFDSVHGPGLRRFLSFIKELQEGEMELDVAPGGGELDDVVRIMSIHHAKGLEFPVVFVAGLGNQMNLGDRSGRLIVDRAAGVGLRVIDTERMIEFPSVAHLQVANAIERTTREEELRVLYVAMTRAREKLVLVGSARDIEKLRDECGGPNGSFVPPSRVRIETARAPLDWLVPVILGSPNCERVDTDTSATDSSLFEAHFHTVAQMEEWRTERPRKDEDEQTRKAVARLELLPSHEPLAPDDPQVDEVVSRLEFVYPHLAATSVRASIAASEAEGALDSLPDPHAESHRGDEVPFTTPPSKYAASAVDSAAHKGNVTHRVLQHIDFAVATDAAGLASELQRMSDDEILTCEDRNVLDEQSLAWFINTPLAGRIRAAGDAFRREFLFTSSEPPALLESAVGSTDDRVLVRGIVDGILPSEDGIEILDYKTDAVDASETEVRMERHRPQMAQYARAMARIWRKPVKRCWLVFLTPRETVSWDEAADVSIS